MLVRVMHTYKEYETSNCCHTQCIMLSLEYISLSIVFWSDKYEILKIVGSNKISKSYKICQCDCEQLHQPGI